MGADVNIRLILEQIKESNEAAESRLFRLYFPYVKSICNRYSKNEEESKEMLNDTFLKIFSNIEKYDPEYDFKPWARKICINCCLSYNKKYFSTQNTVTINNPESFGYSGEEAFIGSFDPDECLSVLKELSPRYRTVFNMFVFEEMKHHEIAQELNISVGSSKSDLSRAKTQLLEIMRNKKPEYFKNKMIKNG